jgi:dihydroxy-acid dehydratase
MSGTAYGAVILHVTPDAATGGPLGLVETGDQIRLSVKNKSIDLLVDEATLAKRRAAKPAAKPAERRGYDRLYHAHILQADQGCDFDFC